MSTPTLRVQGLSCGYAATEPLFTALDLSLSPGEALAVVGPNGSGKTTLLRTVAGQLPLLSGTVQIGGAELQALRHRERARLVSVLTQEDLGDGTLTVRELVELGRTPYLGPWGRLSPRDHAAVDQALVACRLEPLADRRLDRISGGERQRARIAMTVAQQTDLLLLDEPGNHLDLRRRLELYELLRSLRRDRGLATLMVLHDLTEAYREADRVLVLGGAAAQEVGHCDPQRTEKLAKAFEVPEDRIPPLA